MKKTSLRHLLIALLILTSLGSYIYLNTVELHADHASPNIEVETENQHVEDSEMLLPDVQMVKRVLEYGKRIGV